MKNLAFSFTISCCLDRLISDNSVGCHESIAFIQDAVAGDYITSLVQNCRVDQENMLGCVSMNAYRYICTETLSTGK